MVGTLPPGSPPGLPTRAKILLTAGLHSGNFRVIGRFSALPGGCRRWSAPPPEELGVSRQSVYKWESGSALPEIEKLIAMSRLFTSPSMNTTEMVILSVRSQVSSAVNSRVAALMRDNCGREIFRPGLPYALDEDGTLKPTDMVDTVQWYNGEAYSYTVFIQPFPHEKVIRTGPILRQGAGIEIGEVVQQLGLPDLAVDEYNGDGDTVGEITGEPLAFSATRSCWPGWSPARSHPATAASRTATSTACRTCPSPPGRGTYST